MLVSVVICTHNRGESLKRTLDSFLGQENLSNILYELILVDNNSNDHTRELIGAYVAKHVDVMRYFFEKNQGISFARNRGISESKGDVVVFTDDDVVIDKNWLCNILNVFQDPDVDAVQGRIDLGTVYVDKDGIISDQLVRQLFAYVDYGEGILRMPVELDMVGANMAFRKSLFTEHGIFSNLFIFYEDTEFSRRLDY
jgi:glycosyltransferase involved in cell wall biosynthesis